MSGESTSASTESPGPPQVVTLNQSQNSKTQVCKFFVKHQSCDFGNKCRFLHPKSSYPVYVQRSFAVEDAAVNQAPRNTQPKVYIPPHRLRTRHHEAIKKRSDEDPLPINQNRFGQVCKFFSRNGFCKFGDQCKYLHEEPRTDLLDDGEDLRGETYARHDGARRRRGRGGRQRGTSRPQYSGEEAYPTEAADKKNARKQPNEGKRKQLCRYFKKGDCRQGETCKFWHPVTELPVDEEDGEAAQLRNESKIVASDPLQSMKNDESKSGGEPRPIKEKVEPISEAKKIVVQPATELSIETLTDEDAAKQRIAEINTLMKRFPRAEQTSIPRRSEEAYKIVFVPSDPDWPYDVKEIQMTLLFPETYPRECMVVKLSKEQSLPDTVRRFLYNSIADWLNKRYERLLQRMRVELILRPFLRWLDKNAEDLFTEGLKQYQRELMAKAAGIEIVTAGELKEKYAADSDDEEEEEEDEAFTESDSEEYSDEDVDELEEGNGEPARQDNSKEVDPKTSIDPVKKGTEVKLHNLQLKDGAVTLLGLKLQLVVQCDRCKNKDEISVRQNQGVSLICGKCSNTCMVAFRPAIVHQFSSILGYLDVLECHAFDLILSESEFMVGCENCNKEMKVQGIAPGQPRDMWCQFCHQKLKVIVETTRFLNLQPNEIAVSNLNVVAGKKAMKMVKDPAIREGFPLPETGTCRHYKKSYRWLRFPCCGKAYPCDVCHDEKEDHPMTYANRMICGFCSREQHYAADRPCKGCDSSMTKKITTHWEGGKGCRDKITMSRGDDRKYANANKTISRHAQQLKSTGKKTTKLRHT